MDRSAEAYDQGCVMVAAVRETGRFTAELEFGGLLTVLELERGGTLALATEDGRQVCRVSDGV
jgi:hypothetical protein